MKNLLAITLLLTPSSAVQLRSKSQAKFDVPEGGDVVGLAAQSVQDVHQGFIAHESEITDALAAGEEEIMNAARSAGVNIDQLYIDPAMVVGAAEQLLNQIDNEVHDPQAQAMAASTIDSSKAELKKVAEEGKFAQLERGPGGNFAQRGHMLGKWAQLDRAAGGNFSQRGAGGNFAQRGAGGNFAQRGHMLGKWAQIERGARGNFAQRGAGGNFAQEPEPATNSTGAPPMMPPGMGPPGLMPEDDIEMGISMEIDNVPAPMILHEAEQAIQNELHDLQEHRGEILEELVHEGSHAIEEAGQNGVLIDGDALPPPEAVLDVIEQILKNADDTLRQSAPETLEILKQQLKFALISFWREVKAGFKDGTGKEFEDPSDPQGMVDDIDAIIETGEKDADEDHLGMSTVAHGVAELAKETGKEIDEKELDKELNGDIKEALETAHKEVDSAAFKEGIKEGEAAVATGLAAAHEAEKK